MLQIPGTLRTIELRFPGCRRSAVGVFMFIAVIGPSGAGKTSCCRAAAKYLTCGFIDLDGLIKTASGITLSGFFSWAHRQAPSTFFDFGKALCAVARSGARGRNVFVAVGAGSIDYASNNMEAVRAWLVTGFDSIICVYDEPENAFARNPIPREERNLQQYIKSEYSPARETVYAYANARHNVSGADESSSQNAFVEVVRTQLGM